MTSLLQPPFFASFVPACALAYVSSSIFAASN